MHAAFQRDEEEVQVYYCVERHAAGRKRRSDASVVSSFAKANQSVGMMNQYIQGNKVGFCSTSNVHGAECRHKHAAPATVTLGAL